MSEKSVKMFYTMGEVAEMFDVNHSLIRFWEQRFDILKPKKNKKGNRLFTPADVKNLEIIYHLVKERGMTLAGAEKYLKENLQGSARDAELAKRLNEVRALLLEIKAELRDETKNSAETYENPVENSLATGADYPEYPLPEETGAENKVTAEDMIALSAEWDTVTEITETETDAEQEYFPAPEESPSDPDEVIEQEKEEISLPFTPQKLFDDEPLVKTEEPKPPVIQQSLF